LDVRQGLSRVAAWVRIAVCVLCLLGSSPYSAAQQRPATGAGPSELIVIDSASFSADNGGSWAAVALPDTWARRGLSGLGVGRYAMQFELPQRPAASLSMVFTRMSGFYRVSLNGVLIADHGDTPAHLNRRNAAARIIDLPAVLLRQGANELQIEVRYKSRSGLSALHVGHTGAVRDVYEHAVLLDETLPRALNMATAGLALFMLAIWWRRRSEVALGAFGAMMLVGAVRNFGYAGTYAEISIGLFDWLVFSSQVATTVLLGFFAQALAGTSRPFRLLLIMMAVVLPLGALLAAYLDHMELASRLQGNMALDRMDMLRRFVYPVLTLTSLAGMALLVRHARTVPGRRVIAPVLGVVVLIASGVHDYAFQTGLLPITDRFWLPMTMPLVMSGLAMLLVGRLVNAMNAVEILNTDLDRRVALRTRELEAANAEKTRFLAAATHDLRQPVVTVGLLLGMAQDLMRESASPARTLIDRARAALDTLESLLRDLLDLSRVESGVNAPILQSVSLAALFESTQQHVEMAALRKGLSVRFRPSLLYVRSDPVLLEQILRNLVDNAVRYTTHGGVLVSARRRGPDTVLLQVRDTGRGIAPQDQQSIFDEYVQLAPTPSSVPRGTGLGLSIVRRAAQALGAALTLDSRPGRGSCFSLRCPRDSP
jgi:signal transduction histidine kinase